MNRTTKTVHVLAADDDDAIRGNHALLLRSEGFSVIEPTAPKRWPY
jgi:FixJ family two-component response regulator